MLLVDGDSFAKLDRVGDPAKNFALIIKDFRIQKNLLHPRGGSTLSRGAWHPGTEASSASVIDQLDFELSAPCPPFAIESL
jgi:hypothetical protein